MSTNEESHPRREDETPSPSGTTTSPEGTGPDTTTPATATGSARGASGAPAEPAQVREPRAEWEDEDEWEDEAEWEGREFGGGGLLPPVAAHDDALPPSAPSAGSARSGLRGAGTAGLRDAGGPGAAGGGAAGVPGGGAAGVPGGGSAAPVDEGGAAGEDARDGEGDEDGPERGGQDAAERARGETGTAEPAPGESRTAERARGETGTAEPAPGETGTAEPPPGETGTAEPAPGETGTAEGAEAVARPRVLRWSRSPAAILVGVLIGLLGFGIAVQVRSNTSTSGLPAARQEDLVRILDDLSSREDRLRRQIAELEAARARLSSAGDTSTTALQEARKRSDALGILAGTVPAQGPGVVLTITDPAHRLAAEDLLDTVEELRAAGAEAIQVGGIRIGLDSSFTAADTGIAVDGVAVTVPYTILAIGDPPTLATAMGIPGGVADTAKRAGGEARTEQRQQVVIRALRPVKTPHYSQPTN